MFDLSFKIFTEVVEMTRFWWKNGDKILFRPEKRVFNRLFD